MANTKKTAEKITAIVVDFERKPKVVQIKKGLEPLQKAVGGNIDVIYPFADEVGLVVNDEGKIEGLPLNRSLRFGGALRDSGEIYDIIYGKFLVVGLGEGVFCDLTEAQQEKFMERFADPEFFFNVNGKTVVYKGKTRLVSRL